MGTVCQLPTAAPRQVRQRWNKCTREARGALPQFPDRYIHPATRRAVERAKAYKALKLSPTHFLAQALFEALPPEQKRLAQLFLIASSAHPDALAALRVTELSGMSFGDRLDFDNALQALCEGRL